jgi:hypothetical protein
MAFGDLTTLADVRAWLTPAGGTLPADDDALLATLITAASGYIEQWIGRNISPVDYQEVRDGLGYPSNRFVFANFPVTAVLLVLVNGVTIPAVPATIPAPPGIVIATFPGSTAGYLFTPTELVVQGYYVPRRPLCVTLQYTAGYATPPPDLAQACKELVALRYKERNRPGVVSEVMQPGTTVSYSQKDMSDPIKALLQKYKAVAPVSSFITILAPTPTNPATIIGAL